MNRRILVPASFPQHTPRIKILYSKGYEEGWIVEACMMQSANVIIHRQYAI